MSLTPIMDSALPALRTERQIIAASSSDGSEPPSAPGRRDIVAHLNALGHVDPWTPRRDLALVDTLRSGLGLEAAATAAGVTRTAALSRWFHLLLDISLDTQAMTHAELRQGAAGHSDET